MPAAAIIAPIVIDAAAEAGASALIGGVVSSTFVVGAIGGAVGGAISSAAFGGNPGMSALTGAISGGVGGGVGGELQGVSPLEKGAITGATSFGTGTATSLLQGQNIGNALKSGAISGLGSGIASGVGAELFGGDQGPTSSAPSGADIPRVVGEPSMVPSNVQTGDNFVPFNPDPGFSSESFNFNNQPGSSTQNNNNQFSVLSGPAQSALSYGIQSGLSDLFGSNTPTSTSSGLALPSFNQSSGTATNTSNANNPIGQGINALTQALTTVSDLGYSPGGPVFGSQSGSTPRKVWNQASLRVTDDTDNQ